MATPDAMSAVRGPRTCPIKNCPFVKKKLWACLLARADAAAEEPTIPHEVVKAHIEGKVSGGFGGEG